MRPPIGASQVPTHQPGLDGIRGIAVALVLASHFIPTFGTAGWIGVTVFFVLSGFLITRLLVGEVDKTGRVDLAAFYVRRGGRLIPELVAVVLIVTIVGVVTGERNAVFNALGSLTYTADLTMAGGGLLGPLSHTWSLAVEEQFYLLWPAALMLLLTRRPLVPVIGLALAALVWRDVLIVAEVSPGRYFGPDLQLDALMAGCALALASRRAPSRTLVVVAMLVIGAATFAQAIGGLGLQASLGIPATVVGTVILISAVESGRGRWLSFAPLAGLGVISYSLYLWHVPILFGVWAVFGQHPASTVLAVVLATMAAAVSHRLAMPIRIWARGVVRSPQVDGGIVMEAA